MDEKENFNRVGLDPRLIREWHPTKNQGLSPSDVTPHSHKKIWWFCKNGHEWKAIIKDRTYGRGCPYCSGKRASPGHSLAENEGLSGEWHPTRNGELTPEKTTPFSRKKVWWLCRNGHEWEATVASRSSGRGCPYCSRRKLEPVKSLAGLRQKLATEWHPTKNGDLKPSDVSLQSNRKVWWKCKNGHEWRTTIQSRTEGRGCPNCWKNRQVSLVRNPPLERSGLLRKPLLENSLATLGADISREWHPTKNGTLTPADFTPGSHRKVWWKCSRDHVYPATIKSRTNGTGCPKCSNQTSRREIAIFCEVKGLFSDAKWKERIKGVECDIYIPNYRIAVEVDGLFWHQAKAKLDLSKNAKLESAGIAVYRVRDRGLAVISANDIVVGTRESNFGVISKLLSSISFNDRLSEEDRAKIVEYIKGKALVNTKEYKRLLSCLPGPPAERSLSHMHPEITKDWHPFKNAPLTPSQFSSNSNKKVWWLCEKGHEWQATITNRVGRGSKCPECGGRKVGNDNNLAVSMPDIAKQWHPTKNGDLLPSHVTPGSHRKVWWQCEAGHEWQAKVQSRNRGHNCPECSGKKVGKNNCLAVCRPNLALEWHPEKNGLLTPQDVTTGSNKKVWWRCTRGHEWQAVVNSRTDGRGCPECRGNKVRPDNKLALVRPDLVPEWHPTNNGTLRPSDVAFGSHKKVWWKCENGHEWQARIQNRVHGTGCPECWQQKKNRI